MLDDIIEFVFEFIFELIFEILSSIKVPRPLKIGLGAVVLCLVLGGSGTLIGMGIKDANMIMVVLGIGLIVLFAGLAIYTIRRHRSGIDV